MLVVLSPQRLKVRLRLFRFSIFHFPDNTLAEFHKICDMKGIRRTDQTQLIDLYKKMVPESVNGEDAVLDAADDKGRIKKLENLIKKRLPN
jgi:hypothetical protein